MAKILNGAKKKLPFMQQNFVFFLKLAALVDVNLHHTAHYNVELNVLRL